MYRKLKIVLLLLCFSISAVFGQYRFQTPRHGFTSEKPAPNWEHSLLSGNGTTGIMVAGEPYREVINVSHALLYLPLNITDAKLPQGEHLDEIRTMLLNGEYKKASQFLNDLRKKSGFFVNIDFRDGNNPWYARDPFIPGFQIHIEQESDTGGTEYQRSVNFETGETFTEWKNGKGFFRRSAFVSRPDSLIVIRLTGSAKINASISFAEVPVSRGRDRGASADPFLLHEECFTELKPELTGQWLTFKARYRYSNIYNPYGGYEGVGKVINRGGTLRYLGGSVIATDVDELLVIVKIEPVPLKTESLADRLMTCIESKQTDYGHLLAEHVKVHGDLYNRVKLDLGGDPSDRALTSEQLIARSRQETTPPLAMLEQAFNAGRYNIISSTGINPPNLQGVWSGTWSAPWYGSFTSNGNLQVAIAFLLNGNTPSLMQSLFSWVERNLDGFRTSARELFNCRGFYIPVQMTTSWRTLDAHTGVPHTYGINVTAWIVKFYYEYYQYTGDMNFLKEKAYPLMKELAEFFEDFLTVERDGKFVFVPSYSPENVPSNTRTAASINATMDIMACKQLLQNCIQAATLLKEDKADIEKWNGMLSKMPEYRISDEGALCEWTWPGLNDNNDHRHVSHLYALYDEMPQEFKHSPELLRAVEKTIDLRLGFREKSPGMNFGLCLTGWVAAHTGNSQLTGKITDVLAKLYWTTGMGATHDPGHIFNMDICGGFPYLVAQCLAYSEPGYISLLPAKPDRWKQGKIEGLLLRGNVVLQSLSWNETSVEATLLSPHPAKVKVEYKGTVKTVKLQKNVPVK
ncbi:MAG: glycoside hydrolase N-terminal domain-containing protein, partial [Prevotellaceae bacterium]|nr:glycoside hydrolase N-terminal domain-containing protein [Prevotellaceae bacterium]